MPKSGIVVLPNKTQPASRTRAVGGASEALGVMSPAAVPKGAGMPFTAILSLIVIGTPSSGLSGLRRRHRSCEAAAIASAPAASMTYIALILFSQASSSAIGGRQLMGGKVMKCNHRSFRNVNLVLRLVSHRRGRSNHVGFSPTQRRCIDVSRRFYF